MTKQKAIAACLAAGGLLLGSGRAWSAAPRSDARHSDSSAQRIEAHEELALWPGVAPGSEGLADQEKITERSSDPARHDRIWTGIVRPTLRPCRPRQPNGAGMIIVPGGGYSRIVIDKEGDDICGWLNALGVTAFVLKYRLPDEGHRNGRDVPLQDAQRAMRLVRSKADSLGLDPSRIGIIGFSAGGHLAGSLGVHHSRQVYAARDQVDQLSARPDFVVLGYPFVGRSDTRPEDLASLSPRQQLGWEYPIATAVSAEAPPMFLFHAGDDPAVSPGGSVAVYEALRGAGVSAELHLFRSGGHGFGIKDAVGPVARWPELCADWMRGIGVLEVRPAN